MGGRFWAAQYKVILASFGQPPFGGRKKGEGVKKEGGRAYFLGDILILKEQDVCLYVCVCVFVPKDLANR